MKEKVLAAEAALEKSKGVVQALGVAEKTEAVYQLGMLNVRVIAQMLDLGTVYEKTKWESLESISEDCFRKFHWYINVCFVFQIYNLNHAWSDHACIGSFRSDVLHACPKYFHQDCLTRVLGFSIRGSSPRSLPWPTVAHAIAHLTKPIPRARRKGKTRRKTRRS